MLPIVARAKTLTGLVLQFIRMRWNAFGKRGKLIVLSGLVLGAVAAFQLGACYFGACGAASPCDAPCEVGQADEDAPCPYAARAAAEAEAEALATAEDDEDVPPCHRR